MKKPVFCSELAWLVGLCLIAWGTALTVWADLGVSTVVAPAFILHLAMKNVWEWFSFGISEYVLQAFVLILMMLLLQKIKIRYFLSFGAAIIYGILLDLGTFLIGHLLPIEASFSAQIGVYVLGNLGVCCGVALMIRTYLPPEIYEMFIKEITHLGAFQIRTVKTLYDCASLLLALILSLALLGKIEGIGIATLICALFNGIIIDRIGILLDKLWDFRDIFPLRPKFEEGVD